MNTPKKAPLEMSGEEFKRVGYALVDRVAAFLDELPSLKVTPDETPEAVRALLGAGALPEEGRDPQAVLDRACELLFGHSLFNGHPRFFGYVNCSAAPMGALGDMLASAINPNGSGWHVSPMASEIERQTVRWIAELIGYPADAGGLIVSGGNAGNFVGVLAARRALAPAARAAGMNGGALKIYTSKETHTWIHKAADMFGFGLDAVRWVPVDRALRMDLDALSAMIAEDRARGGVPLCVVGNAGTVSTGAIDRLGEISAICKREGVWFHVDGAYGAMAAVLPDAPADLTALSLADSVAVDPHKWMYAPIEAGCALVRDASILRDTFLFRPQYYHSFIEPTVDSRINYNEYGPQNSRACKALKVWLQVQQVGRSGYRAMIGENIRLARYLYDRTAREPELAPLAANLSITTFRFVPRGLDPRAPEGRARVNQLNNRLLSLLKRSGEAYVSHAIVEDDLWLRACIVNFRTTEADLEALVDSVLRIGREL